MTVDDRDASEDLPDDRPGTLRYSDGQISIGSSRVPVGKSDGGVGRHASGAGRGKQTASCKTRWSG